MPFATANNAVCEAEVDGNKYVYSFGGIDTSKIWSGIHKRCFRYDVSNQMWSELDTLPSEVSVIAAAASYVNGKIYVMGGYEVLENHNEISSNRVHIFNPETNLFEDDGASIPKAIDDQVQCVYKDSLIYLVTGWSNTSNQPDVQIYNTYTNTWQSGTPTTNNAYYTSFGASGYIVGDTIFYYGGAGGGGFAARRFMRRGVIDPNDPTQISWDFIEDAPGPPSYRGLFVCQWNHFLGRRLFSLLQL